MTDSNILLLEESTFGDDVQLKLIIRGIAHRVIAPTHNLCNLLIHMIDLLYEIGDITPTHTYRLTPESPSGSTGRIYKIGNDMTVITYEPDWVILKDQIETLLSSMYRYVSTDGICYLWGVDCKEYH